MVILCIYIPTCQQALHTYALYIILLYMHLHINLRVLCIYLCILFRVRKHDIHLSGTAHNTIRLLWQVN